MLMVKFRINQKVVRVDVNDTFWDKATGWFMLMCMVR
jgi:hypothetical protein